MNAHAPDSSIFISTYIVGRYATVFYDYARPVADARWVWVWEIYRRDARSLARSFAAIRSLFHSFLFIYFFFPFFLFFLFFLFYSSFFPSPSPSLPVSLALLPRPSRFSRCRAALDRAYLLLRGCSGDRRPSVNIVWLLLRRTFERWQRA